MRIEDEVRDLCERVPCLPSEPLNGGATDAVLDEFAARNALVLPPAFRQWLKLHNGANIGPGGLYGIAPPQAWLDIETLYKFYPEWRARQWLLIAGDGVGDYYVLDASGPKGTLFPVYFLDHEVSITEPDYVVASGLWQFLRFLLQEEGEAGGWPFDRAYVLTMDPALQTYSGTIPLPW